MFQIDFYGGMIRYTKITIARASAILIVGGIYSCITNSQKHAGFWVIYLSIDVITFIAVILVYRLDLPCPRLSSTASAAAAAPVSRPVANIPDNRWHSSPPTSRVSFLPVKFELGGSETPPPTVSSFYYDYILPVSYEDIVMRVQNLQVFSSHETTTATAVNVFEENPNTTCTQNPSKNTKKKHVHFDV